MDKSQYVDVSVLTVLRAFLQGAQASPQSGRYTGPPVLPKLPSSSYLTSNTLHVSGSARSYVTALKGCDLLPPLPSQGTQQNGHEHFPPHV